MIILSSKHCLYCNDLKTKLDKLNIKYGTIDVDDDSNKSKVEPIFKMVGEEVIPIIIFKPHVLAPKRSFNTIDEAVKLIIDLNKK